MAEPSSIDNGGKDATPAPQMGKAGPYSDLPQVESPSISPANDGIAAARSEETAPQIETPVAETAAPDSQKDQDQHVAPAVIPAGKRFVLTPRMKRTALRAATVAVAAAFGAIAGALTMQGLAPGAVKQDVASVEERQAMQKSIVRLARDIAVMKAGIEAANKATTTQIEKIAGRIERADRLPEATGSIVRTAVPAEIGDTPLPQPRPQIVQGWSVHQSRDGFVLAEQQGGELFRISPGVPLPGLGTVETIRRDNGRLVVVTQKGLIVQAASATARTRYRPPFFYERD